jgi:hypothetical protein
VRLGRDGATPTFEDLGDLLPGGAALAIYRLTAGEQREHVSLILTDSCRYSTSHGLDRSSEDHRHVSARASPFAQVSALLSLRNAGIA